MTPSLILDLFLISLVLFLAIRSAIIGFLDELFGVGPFVLGAYLGLMFMHLLKPYVAKCMNQTLASVVSFLLIFSVVFLVMKIIQAILKKIFESQIMTSFDHGLGFLYGAAEGVFLIVIIFIVMVLIQNWADTQSLRDGSFLYKFFKGLIDSACGQVLEQFPVGAAA